jgi:hypothetical protein
MSHVYGVPEMLLSAMQAAGVVLNLDVAGRLVIQAPRGALTAAMREGIMQYKPQLEWMAHRRRELLADDWARAVAYGARPQPQRQPPLAGRGGAA